MNVRLFAAAVAPALLSLCIVPARASAASVQVFPLAMREYVPDSVITAADGSIWFSAARIAPCPREVSCQREALGTIGSRGAQEKSLGAFTVGSLYGATPGPASTIWVTDVLTAAHVFNLSGTEIAHVRVSHHNGSGALSAPFVGPDGRMWFGAGSFGLGGNGIVAVNADYSVSPVAKCRKCFFSGGIVGSDGNAWLLDPYLGGFYRVTAQGEIERFDYGHAVLQTLVAGPGGNLWGTVQGGVAEYDLSGNLVASFATKIPVQSGLIAYGGSVVWARFGSSKRSNDALDLVTMQPTGAVDVRHVEGIGACPASSAQWFSSGPAVGGDGDFYIGVGCSSRQPPYTVGGLAYVVRIAP